MPKVYKEKDRFHYHIQQQGVKNITFNAYQSSNIQGFNPFFKQDRWNRFKNQYERKNFKTLEDFIRVYINRFKEQHQHYDSEFCILCPRKGLCSSTCEARDSLTDYILKYGSKKTRQTQSKAELKKIQGKINKKTGDTFEIVMATIFKNMGYQVFRTNPNHDYGADIILEHLGEKTAVQLKCQKDTVGVSAVQEVVAAKRYYGCQNALVVCTSEFTKSAKNLASSNFVALWGGDKYTEMLRRYFLS